jgi:hypothetical protein
VVVLVLKHEKHLMKLEPEEHEVLVNPIVVYLVPMQVEYVNESLKPLLLSLFADFNA